MCGSASASERKGECRFWCLIVYAVATYHFQKQLYHEDWEHLHSSAECSWGEGGNRGIVEIDTSPALNCK